MYWNFGRRIRIVSKLEGGIGMFPRWGRIRIASKLRYEVA